MEFKKTHLFSDTIKKNQSVVVLQVSRVRANNFNVDLIFLRNQHVTTGHHRQEISHISPIPFTNN
jgi:hypothetical protein